MRKLYLNFGNSKYGLCFPNKIIMLSAQLIASSSQSKCSSLFLNDYHIKYLKLQP